MNKIKSLSVLYHGRKVGTLALYQNRLAAFEYTSEWLAEGFSINPFSLPLQKKVFLPKVDPSKRDDGGLSPRGAETVDGYAPPDGYGAV